MFTTFPNKQSWKYDPQKSVFFYELRVVWFWWNTVRCVFLNKTDTKKKNWHISSSWFPKYQIGEQLLSCSACVGNHTVSDFARVSFEKAEIALAANMVVYSSSPLYFASQSVLITCAFLWRHETDSSSRPGRIPVIHVGSLLGAF